MIQKGEFDSSTPIRFEFQRVTRKRTECEKIRFEKPKRKLIDPKGYNNITAVDVLLDNMPEIVHHLQQIPQGKSFLS